MNEIELSTLRDVAVGFLGGFLFRSIYSISVGEYTDMTQRWKALSERAQETMTQMMAEIVRLNDECTRLTRRGQTVGNSQKWEVSHPVGVQSDSVPLKPSDFQSDK
jgi:hypothetical protein